MANEKAKRELTASEAIQGARNALAVANAGVDSQLAVQQALDAAAQALERDGDKQQAAVFSELWTVRAKLLLQVAERTVEQAESAFERHGSRRALSAVLAAASRVRAVCDPGDGQYQALADRAQELSLPDEPPPARPFFARFLENQNRQRVASRRAEPAEVVVTLKSPSDHEESGDVGDEVVVTLKFPSDQEDGGPVTKKFPSDEEDAGNDCIMVTLKSPSDHEDGGTGFEEGVFVTLKFPSDHDEDIDVEGQASAETRKFPSDQEDTSADSLASTPVTMKAPSDHEDGGGLQVGGEDAGSQEVVVTLKAPSDHEDGGIEPPLHTKKFPSDAEDTGYDGQGPVTLKFPSDREDGGPGDEQPPAVTLKFPSDNDEGDDEVYRAPITLKFPSDREDGDPGLGPVVTAKFPSDEEDQGLDLGDAVVVTLKFPSDSDEGDPWLEAGCNWTTAKFPSDRDE